MKSNLTNLLFICNIVVFIIIDSLLGLGLGFETAENSQSKPRVCNIVTVSVPQSIINHVMDKVYKAIVG